MNQNSIDTYRKFVEPNLTEREKEVYEVIKRHPEGITGYEVANELGRFPNQISGRFSKLVEKGCIILNGFKKLPGMKTDHGVWIAIKEGDQLKLY